MVSIKYETYLLSELLGFNDTQLKNTVAGKRVYNSGGGFKIYTV